MLYRRILFLLAFLVIPLTSRTQTLSNFDLLAKLRLLHSERNVVDSLLSEGAFSVWNQSNRQTFFRYSENIDIDYSTGKCTDVTVDESNWIGGFFGPDVWNVPQGKIVGVSFEPKVEVDIRNLGIDLTKFTKERLNRVHDNHFIYFDKISGMAVRTWDTQVESIELFPGKEHHDKLCANSKLAKHFSSSKWRVVPEKNKDYCILLNKPSNVRDVSVVKSAVESRFEISVTADDPENDVMTFNYFVNAGQITHIGAKATWDLTGVKPGTYEIKVAADDGVGPRGLWVTKSITIN